MGPVTDRELERLRTMTTAEKLDVMHALWREAWVLTTAGVRARHPEWTSEQVVAEVRRAFLQDEM